MHQSSKIFLIALLAGVSVGVAKKDCSEGQTCGGSDTNVLLQSTMQIYNTLTNWEVEAEEDVQGDDVYHEPTRLGTGDAPKKYFGVTNVKLFDNSRCKVWVGPGIFAYNTDGYEPVKPLSPLNGDLNQNAGGKEIYLCMKKGYALIENLLSDLKLCTKIGCGTSSGGWTAVPHIGEKKWKGDPHIYSEGLNGDLNEKAGGKTIYLGKSTSRSPFEYITDLQLSENKICLSGYSRARQSDALDGDMNQKAGGKDIYLCVQKACTCAHGTPARGEACPKEGDKCVACQEGYLLQGVACNSKNCTCELGPGAKGKKCPNDGDAWCGSCFEKERIVNGNNGKCEIKQCKCNHGEGLTGKDCYRHGGWDCHPEKCDPKYHFSYGKAFGGRKFGRCRLWR